MLRAQRTGVACNLALALMAAGKFVRYSSQGEIVDVEEFEVARAIVAGDTQPLSQQIESKHLFELCIACGHQSTAAALLNHGVPGCRVELRHLGPFAAEARSATGDCGCGSTWETCNFCCWGAEVESGVWMKDWDAKLEDAVAAAREAALRSGEDFFRNFDVSEAAMARLLDLAILTGDAGLAQQCTQRCTRRPLRRWCSEGFFDSGFSGPISAVAPEVLAAASFRARPCKGSASPLMMILATAPFLCAKPLLFVATCSSASA